MVWGWHTYRVCVGYGHTNIVPMNNEIVHFMYSAQNSGLKLYFVLYFQFESESLVLAIQMPWVSGWLFAIKGSVPKPKIHMHQGALVLNSHFHNYLFIFSGAILNLKTHYSSCLLSYTLWFGVLSASMRHGAAIWHTEQNHIWVNLWKEFCVENYFICKCMDENIAEELQEGSVYSNDYYTENKYQTKLNSEKQEKKNFKKTRQRYKWPAKPTISSRLLYYTVFSCWWWATY